jgi:hypothetical protein
MYIDDIENNIANIIDLNKIVIKTDTQVELATNQEFVINAHTELNDNLYDTKLLYTILNGSQYISLTDNVVKGIIEGQAQIKVYVENNPDIYTIIDLSIRSDAGEKVSYYIKGDGSIKWGRTKTYGFYKSINGVEELIDTKFEIEDNEELLLDAEYGSANAILTANKNNNVGTVVLKTTYNDIVYSKEIKIVSLWM